MKQEAVMKRLRDYVAAEESQRTAAAKIGVSASYLGDVLAGRRTIGPTILKAIGLERDVQYRETSGG